jgi:hypothetical protein
MRGILFAVGPKVSLFHRTKGSGFGTSPYLYFAITQEKTQETGSRENELQRHGLI